MTEGRVKAMAPPADVLPFRAVNQLLQPGYLPLETGWTRLANGTIFVANRTEFPGSAPAMFDWWFWWHGAGGDRYRRWYPEAHRSARFRYPKRLRNPRLTDREKYIGNDSRVAEYIGETLQRLVISFRPPAEFGFDVSHFPAAHVGTVICARVRRPGLPIDVARMVHLVRQIPGGCELRSRFWIGENLRYRWLKQLVLPNTIGPDLQRHCAAEYRRLADFLPDIWRKHRA